MTDSHNTPQEQEEAAQPASRAAVQENRRSSTPQRSLLRPQLPKLTPWFVGVGAVIVAAALSWLLIDRVGLVLTAILAGLINLVAIFALSFAVEGKRRAVDRVATTLVVSSFVIACLPLIALLWMTFDRGTDGLSFNLITRSMQGMMGSFDQQYVAGEGELLGGFYHAIIGTLLITLATSIIAIPVGILTAIYLVEYGRKSTLARSITFLVDVMTGIPSIVAGLFAFALFRTVAEWFGVGGTDTKNGLSAAIALSVLMIPIVVRNTEEILRIVPMDLREASYALGVPKWKTIVRIVLPTAISGIFSGVTISIARVIGETAPILVAAGFAMQVNWNLFSGWMSSLPTYIYSQAMRPTAPGAAIASSERAWAAALILVIIVMVLNLIARISAKLLAPKGER